VLVGCVRLQHIAAMVASLDAILFGFGAVFAVVGLVLMIRGGARQEEHSFEGLGLKIRFTSAGPVVFLIGALFLAVPFAVPFFVSADRSPLHEGPPASAPQGGVRPPVRAQDGEVEPNDYVTEANPIELGANYAGAIDRDDKDFFAFEAGPGAPAFLLILRRVQGTGNLVVSVFDPQGRESRVGRLRDVLSEKIDVGEAGTYVLRLVAYGDLRYQMVLQPG
jgi:hypothetical protein